MNIRAEPKRNSKTEIKRKDTERWFWVREGGAKKGKERIK